MRELPLKTTEDFVHMIYIRLYGQRKNMKYEIAAGVAMTVNGYESREYVLRIKAD